MNYKLKSVKAANQRRHCEERRPKNVIASVAKNVIASAAKNVIASAAKQPPAINALMEQRRRFVVGACFGRASLAMTALAVRNCFFGCCVRNNGVDWTFLCV
ncbi:MAG: hypothetical protein LBE13_12890, partial [Bacteroidales bacterium]|nr:hypothetical protein [Bacteroidales bacterium]